MLAIILAVATVTATPSPAPKATPPLKVIVNVKSNAFCAQVRQMAVPIGYVTRRNEEAFGAMDHSMIKFMENMRGVSSATAADLQSMDNSLDDNELYTPTNDITVMQMNQVANAIAKNLTLEDKVMNDSWKAHPKGENAAVDGLRQRMQNLMDLQRALDNRYLEFAGMYIDNQGQARMVSNPAPFKAFLRDSIMGLAGALYDVKTQGDAELVAQASTHDTAKYGNIAQIVRELRLQEMAFSVEIIDSANTCGI